MLIFFIGCSKEQPQYETLSEQVQPAGSVLDSPQFEITAETKFMLQDIQKRIYKSPSDIELRKQFATAAVLPKAIVTAGFGRLTHPETGQAIPQHLAKRAARLDAARWSLYAARWFKNPAKPDFGRLTGKSLNSLQAVDQQISGDSLIVFVAFALPNE